MTSSLTAREGFHDHEHWYQDNHHKRVSHTHPHTQPHEHHWLDLYDYYPTDEEVSVE